MVYSFISHSVYNLCVSIIAYTNSYWYLVVSLVCFLTYFLLLIKSSNLKNKKTKSNDIIKIRKKEPI